MRIVFFGTPELAVPSLEILARTHTVAAVVCQPDKPQGRSKALVPPPVKLCARRLGINVHQPVKLNDGAFETWLRGQRPELCVIVAYGRILRQPILDVPRHGFLNVHPSLLPEYRGPSPIQTAILDGKTESGITIMRLDLQMDSGDILLQEPFAIRPDDTGATLSERMANRGAELLLQGIELIESGRARFTPQDHAKATYCTMLTKETGRIVWSSSAAAIHNRIRACQPWPVAYCKLHGETVRVHASAVEDRPARSAPGIVESVEKDRIIVAASEGTLALLEIQLPGKRALSAAEFLRGRPIEPGDRFEDG